jgi:phosphonatase-like hydrolase
MKFKAVLFDLIGTTVIEKPGTIIGCFKDAFRKNNIEIDNEFLQSHRGRGKKEIIESLLKTRGIPEKTTIKVYDDFKLNVESRISDFSPAPGTDEIFSYVKSLNIKLGIGTGLPRSIFELISMRLGWNESLFDYIGIAEEVGTGRPDPAMIYQMMKKLNIMNGSEFLKVGDTAADIQEGKNAGVKTAVILSGTQDSGILRNENPDYVLESLADIKKIII